MEKHDFAPLDHDWTRDPGSPLCRHCGTDHNETVVLEAQKIVRAAYQKKYYEANKDRIKAQTKAYAIAHPEETRAYKTRYRMEKREMIATHRRSRKKERQELFNAIKLASGCVDCGYNENPIALDFDHRDSRHKRSDVSQMVNDSLTAALEEIAKCDVRCANCHRIKTEERRRGG